MMLKYNVTECFCVAIGHHDFSSAQKKKKKHSGQPQARNQQKHKGNTCMAITQGLPNKTAG
jgi:hypothetical protein